MIYVKFNMYVISHVSGGERVSTISFTLKFRTIWASGEVNAVKKSTKADRTAAILLQLASERELSIFWQSSNK